MAEINKTAVCELEGFPAYANDELNAESRPKTTQGVAGPSPPCAAVSRFFFLGKRGGGLETPPGTHAVQSYGFHLGIEWVEGMFLTLGLGRIIQRSGRICHLFLSIAHEGDIHYWKTIEFALY